MKVHRRASQAGGDKKTQGSVLRSLHPLQVEVSTLDVADMEETRAIVGLAEKMAPVGGIFHLAMVLQDRWLSNQVTPCLPYQISHSAVHTCMHAGPPLL